MCNPEYYQSLIGSINQFAIFTSSDITFAASDPSQFNFNPTAKHLNAILHVFRCLKDTRNLFIIYKQQQHKLIILGHSNSDSAVYSKDIKSFIGYIFMIYHISAIWNSYKQITIAHFFIDLKYMRK